VHLKIHVDMISANLVAC